MKSKTVKIPIYFETMILIKTDDFKKVNKIYKTKAKNKLYDAVVFETIKTGHHVIAIKIADWSVIAHETVHLVNSIFLKCGIQLDRVNDEPQAYLTGWIVNEIDKFLKDQ